MTDTPALDDTVLVGLRIAQALGVPLRIAGRDVYVPPGFIPPLEGVEDDTPDVAHVEVSTLETARRCAFLMRLAAEEIERLGLEVGLWEPPPVPTSRPANILATVLARPEPPEPAVAEVAPGIWNVGAPPMLEVRSTGDASWICVRLSDNTLVAWHPTQLAALAWAKQAARDAWRPDMPRAPDVQPFTYNRRSEDHGSESE